MYKTAALRAAVFFAIRDKPDGGGDVWTPPPARRGLICNGEKGFIDW